MKVLVTGGAGFIGSHVVGALIKQDYQVFIADNLITGRLENVHPAAKFFNMDINDTKLEELFINEKFDYVIHLAAQTAVNNSILKPNYDCQVNIQGTINVLEAARKTSVKRIVFSSSAAVYGDVSSVPIKEDNALAPNSFYGLSKLTAEQYIKLYSKCFGLEHIILRYANVYGERQGDAGEGGVVSIFARAYRKSESINIFGDGGQTRDFIYAGDIAAANCQAIKVSTANTTYNISTSRETSVNELVALFATVTGKTIEKKYLPVRPGDIYRSSLSNTAAINDLDWQPSTSLLDGLTATYNSLNS